MDTLSRLHKVFTPDGMKLTVEDAGTGTPLIFAHGLTSSRAHSRRQLFHLADEYRVIVFDQRGHADSSPINSAQQFSVTKMADDIGCILDYFGLTAAIVGGESLGAGTALRFALSYPRRVTALILCLPALSNQLNVMRQTIRDLGSAMRTMGMNAFADQNARQEIASGLPEKAAHDWADVLRSHDTNSLSIACELTADWLIYQHDNELAGLRMPVHIMAIDNDAVHPLALAQRLQTQIAGATITEFRPGTRYHSDPSMVGDDIREFLNRVQ